MVGPRILSELSIYINSKYIINIFKFGLNLSHFLLNLFIVVYFEKPFKSIEWNCALFFENISKQIFKCQSSIVVFSEIIFFKDISIKLVIFLVY